MTATELLSGLTRAGFTLRVDGEQLLVSPASKLQPAHRKAIQAAKRELVALLGGTFCPACHRELQDGRCWRCGFRPCSRCGRDTASAFIELCNACGLAEE